MRHNGAKQPMQTLYEDDHIRVIFQGGTDLNKVILSFCDLGFVTSGKNKTETFWGAPYFKKIGIPAIGFMPKKDPNWFPEKSIKLSANKVNESTKFFKNRITYGHSMGGYAALKYGKTLNATVALAFCPQYSIDPISVSSFDKRYQRYYNSSINSDMDIKSEDFPEKSYLFFDPLYPTDRRHIELIELSDKRRSTKRIPAPLTAHTTIAAIAGGDTIEKILNQATHEEQKNILKTVRKARRISELRPYAASFVCAANEKFSQAAKIYTAHNSRMTQSHRIELIRMISGGYKKLGDSQAALSWLEKWALLAPLDVHAHLALAEGWIVAGHYERANAAIACAKNITPHNEAVLIKEGTLKEKQGFTKDATCIFHKLIEIYPNSHNALLTSALFFQRNKQFFDAIETFEKALKIKPDHELSLARLVSLNIQRHNYSAARKFAENLVLLHNENKIYSEKLNTLIAISNNNKNLPESSEIEIIKDTFPAISQIESYGFLHYSKNLSDQTPESPEKFKGSDLLMHDKDMVFRGNIRHPLHNELGHKAEPVPPYANIVVLGNSMVHDMHSLRIETWPYILDKIIKSPVYNASVGGSSPIQYLYALSEVLHLRPSKVLFCFFNGNNIFNSLDTSSRLEGESARNLFDLSQGKNIKNPAPPQIKIKRDFIISLGSMPRRAALQEGSNRNIPDCLEFTMAGRKYFLTPHETSHRINVNSAYGSLGFATAINAIEIFSQMARIFKFEPTVVSFPTRERALWMASTSDEKANLKENISTIESIYETEARIEKSIERHCNDFGIDFIPMSPHLPKAVRQGYFKPMSDDFHPSLIGKQEIARILSEQLNKSIGAS